MADRYAIKTGNWNDATVWSATSGGAGGASVPTAGDSVYMGESGNSYTLTLTGDQQCDFFEIDGGNLKLSGYTLTINQAFSAFNDSSVDISYSKIITSATSNQSSPVYFDSTVSLITTSSLIELNFGFAPNASFDTQSFTFNDVVINLGVGGSYSDVLSITGSPTFRLLDIRSANSAAHTVKFQSVQDISVEKFVAIGASSSNRLTLSSTDQYLAYFDFVGGGSCYGQNVIVNNLNSNGSYATPAVPSYIGSNSISQGISSGWLTQDPPKISTLVDPLTTAPGSNGNWTVGAYSGATLPTAVTTGNDGGGYRFDNVDGILSTDTFDLVDEEFIFEVPRADSGFYEGFSVFAGWFDTGGNLSFPFNTLYSGLGFQFDFNINGIYFLTASDGQMNALSLGVNLPITAVKYIKLTLASDGTANIYLSDTGVFGSAAGTVSLTDTDLTNVRSSRISMSVGSNGEANTVDIGSINPSLISAPAVTTGAVTNLANTTVTLAGNVTSDGGATVTERGVVYATTANPTTANSKKTVTGTTGAYTGNVTGLTVGTTYHYRAYAINSIGTSYGADLTFTTDTTPTVTTTSSSSLTDVSATLTGNITATGGKNPTERGFQYGTTSGSYTLTVKEIGSYGTGSFSLSATGLTQTTTYYYRAYTKNTYGIVYGTEKSFTTLKTKPAANFTTDVTSGNYKLLVHFTDTSTQTPTAWAWDFGDGGTSTSQNPQHTYQSAGTFTVKLTATNAGGSNTVTKTNLITVSTVVPTVSTGTTSSVTQTSATLAGSITDFGGTNATERGFNYGTTSGSLTSNTNETGSFAAGSFTLPISALSSNTTYYYQAYAKNTAGTATGTTESFTTAKADATAATGTAGSLTLTGAVITGNSISNPDGQTITERGVAYATTQSPTTANSKVTGTGSPFNVTLSGLTANTTYYARAYVTFAGTTNYGSQISFKTQGTPTVVLNAPASNGSTGLTKAQLDFTGTDPDNDKVVYELQLNPTNSFTAPLLDVVSDTDPGFTNVDAPTNTSPFYSGNKVRYTYQTDLTRGSSYYWRVRAKDPDGSNSWGNWTTAIMFTVTAVAPTVTLTGFSAINDTNLQVSGSVTDTGGATVTEEGAVWSLNANPTTADGKVIATGQPFTASVTGLTASTSYHFRTYAKNSVGTSYSADVVQMTDQPLSVPTVTTTTASNVSDITAQVGGEVTLDGKRTVTERGVVFSTAANPTTADRKFTAATAGLGVYSGTITGLEAETTYHYRAYAINEQGVGYGADKTLTTLAPFVPDQGDGHWTFSVSVSDAIISRDQPTAANSSANLPLEDLTLLVNGQQYTVAVGDITSDKGNPKLVLEWYDGATQHQQTITANSSYTFTYNTSFIHWSLRLFVTQGTAVADNLTATFKNLYLAQEAAFSSYVDFVARGLTEVKIVNNQIVDKRRADVIDSLFSKLSGFYYYPFEIDTEGLGWFQIGDSFDIEDDDSNTRKVILLDKKLTLDGGITETLKADMPDNTTTDYSKAGNVTKLISNTTLQVDKQNDTITALVADVYDDNGYIDNKFSEVNQTIDEVKTTVQGAGGVNLVRNSVMYSYNNLGYPDNWTTVNDTGNAAPLIQASPESISAGGISGNAFTLIGQKVTQTVPVKKDADFISADQKTYYTLSMKVKKNIVGAGYIKLSNRNESHQLDLPDQTSYYWEDMVIPVLLPSDDHYDLEIYSDTDAALQVTDVMLSIGQDRHTWTQAPGELSNTNVSVTQDGMTVRSDQFRYNYTKIDALGFEVHKKILGSSEQIFGFNDDETNVSKLKADNQIAMGSMRIVPVTYNGHTGWAFTPKVGN